MNACKECGSTNFYPLKSDPEGRVWGEACVACDLTLGDCPVCNYHPDNCECGEAGA